MSQGLLTAAFYESSHGCYGEDGQPCVADKEVCDSSLFLSGVVESGATISVY